ncbi:calcium-binding protein, partial [Hydrogenophaga borbori]
MSQPQALTTVQLEAYSQQLANGTLANVEQVYADLYSKGYSYAGWAGGVASESTIAGVSAVNFLTGTAMMGWGGEQCRNLPEATLDSIRMQMATRYVDVLIRYADRDGGVLSSDIDYRDTKEIHEAVFANHNLSLDNWTLNTPMELVRQTQGDEAVEALWGKVRDTGGDGWDALAVNFELYHIVSSLRFDPTYQEQAQTWIDEVPGFANFEEWGRLIDTVKEWLNNTQVGRMWNAIHQVIESDPLFLVNPLLNTAFTSARAVVLQRDPLVLDLDGDGLELSAAGGNVLFDHNADGIKTGTGWARPDDGFLVRDLNGNGLIDSGRELFGVDTVKSNGQMATQGFDALGDLDTNGDGQITSADAAWAQLQVWRDTNQDGISQSGELSGLDALGITRIGLNGSASGPQAGQTINNNRVALSTTFTRNGVNRTVGAIDLEANGFFSQIPPEVVDEAGNPVVITQAAHALPQMNGSGMVRNLRAAMSLTGAQADELEAAVAAFAAAGTREAQRALLDNLITEWAQTSSYWSSLEGYLGGAVTLTPPAGMTGEQYRNMIGVLEAFNGSRFYASVGSAMPVGQSGSTVNGVTGYVINPAAQQVAFLQQAYQALKESVYGALVMQTRLKPYLDAVELTVDGNGVHFDTSGLQALALQGAQTDALNAIKDLTDLRRYGNEVLKGVGWAFEDTMAAVLASVEITPDVTALLTAERLAWMGTQATSFAVPAGQAGFTVIGNALDNSIAGNAAGSEYLHGGQGNDTLTAVGSWDVLDGGAGDDVLKLSNGAEQSTTFIGGAGNDTMTGGGYNDTYVFNRGDGSDTISDYGTHGTSSIYLDQLSFGAGIAVSDVGARRVGVDLVVTVAGVPGDQITIKNWFSEVNGFYRIEQINFADGTVWTHNNLAQLALATTNTGTAGNDTISGTGTYSDRLIGLEGNDTLTAVGSWDVLDGGAGDDVLKLSNGAEQSTTFIGGTGNDTMTGGGYNDTYVFNRGDGSDTISDYGT